LSSSGPWSCRGRWTTEWAARTVGR